MKNIHVLPTDKPSRLYSDKGKLWLDDLVYGDNNQHIYITSDEEIKEGDWFLLKNNIHKVFNSSLNNPLNPMPNYFKKIIITTDQDLIKDGVQYIDDDFLEWFIKNPSCESVEVRKEKYSERFDNDKSAIGNTNTWGNRWVIIIPKEELSTKLHKREIVDESYPKEFKQERSYSEEDMIKFMQFIVSEEELENTSGVSVDTAKYFLNKFKNK